MKQKDKLKINLTTKDPSRKQIIISISINNTEKVMGKSNTYIANINGLLKEIKFDIFADYIYFDNKKIAS